MAEVLSEYDARYDENLHLLGECCRSRGYHTNKKTGEWVHSAERSLQYAVALLDMGDVRRAADIIRAALPMQDRAEEHDTFGLWPYFYEEPLEQMSPPDWNSADFCCKMLLQALVDYDDILPDDLIEEMKVAIQCGCVSIRQRDVEVQYTNVALMDAYVTVLTGERMNRPDLLVYGREKLERFWSYTRTMGALNEFNSPNYNLLVARDLSLFLHQVRDEPARRVAERSYHFVWQGIAAHFSVPFREWAAPNARRYEDFLTDEQLTDLELALGMEGQMIQKPVLGLFTFRYRLTCPSEYLKQFQQARTEYRQEINSCGYLYPYYAFAQVSTTYLTDWFTLGSFNRSECWSQIRPLQGFFGTRESKKSFRFRCLHDGQDFCSGLLHTVQHYGQVLGTVNFSTDRGDTHVSLDRLSDGRFRARDLRLSFSFLGDIGQLRLRKEGNRAFLQDGETGFVIHVLEGSFAGQTPRCEVVQTETSLSFDVIFYTGEEREFCLCELKEAFCSFYLEAYHGAPAEYRTELSHRDGKVRVSLQSCGLCLQLEDFKRPYPFFVLTSQDVQMIDGVRLEDRTKAYDSGCLSDRNKI